MSYKKEVCLVNPALIKRFAQTISLRKTKTDTIDAVIIAKFICKNIEHINYFTFQNIDDITALARVRENLAKEIAKVKTQLKQHLAVVFPELLFNYNVFTNTILHILKELPTTEIIKATDEKTIQKVFDNIKAKHKAKITPQELISLAKNSIGASSDAWEIVIKHDVQMLIFLNEQLEKLTFDFINRINSSKKDDMEIITSIKGISDITAAHFLSEVKDIKRFENRNKLSAYAGIDPSIKQSGSSINSNGRISKKGSKSLRRCLYLMASGVMKFNPYFRAYYLKKRDEGMKHRKAMIALCNKLVRILHAMLTKREVFHMPEPS
jgi:transposase